MAQGEDNKPIHTSISSGFNQHTPAYWRLALPALGARYGFRFVEKLFSLGDKKFIGLGSKQIFDAAAGAWMLGITGFFALRTGRDIQNIFAETVAYELDKDPAKVGFRDLMKSNNNAVAKACRNFTRYNTVRALINTSFFASFLPNTKRYNFKASESVDLGLGLNGAYLTGEVVMRDSTFFEHLQNFVDSKINQHNALGEDIQAVELMRLFERNAVDNDPGNAFRGDVSTALWYQNQQAFQRMADLMNRTYQHEPENKAANFTLPKFLYLLGHNLIQPKNVPQTMAFVEVADRYGIAALKGVVKSMKEGADLNNALQAYPEVLAKLNPAPAIPQAEKNFSGKFASPVSFTEQALRSENQAKGPPVI